ncbi:hypothetical protein KRX54_05835 [Actinomycetaceae bacterium TAE3-ERU4]|nr:hypothetical protein [Actinomycetaceae bacterium TAE3-ERU4]
MKLRKIFVAVVATSASISLVACGSSKPSSDENKASVEDTHYSASVESPKTMETVEPSTGVSPEESVGVTTKEAPKEEVPAELKKPDATELKLDAKIPEAVGMYKGKGKVTSLGQSTSLQVEYSNQNNGRYMTLTGTRVEYDRMDKDVETGRTPIGKIGICGYLYGNKSTPVCRIRLAGGGTIGTGGDYKATLQEVKDFTIRLINLMVD